MLYFALKGITVPKLLAYSVAVNPITNIVQSQWSEIQKRKALHAMLAKEGPYSDAKTQEQKSSEKCERSIAI
jgi:hypothetical protein